MLTICEPNMRTPLSVCTQGDQYETLEIAYTSINAITCNRHTLGLVQITLNLNSPPKVGKDLVRSKNDPSQDALDAVFYLPGDILDTFYKALESRHLVRSPVVLQN